MACEVEWYSVRVKIPNQKVDGFKKDMCALNNLGGYKTVLEKESAESTEIIADTTHKPWRVKGAVESAGGTMLR